MKETWRKEKERQKLHNLLQILDLLDLDHSEPQIHQEMAGWAVLAVLCCWCMWEQSSSLCACARCNYFWLWLKTGYLALRYRQWIMLSSLFFLLLLVVETNTLHATFCRTHLRITRVSHRIMQHSLRPAVARPALHPKPPHPPVRFPAQLQKQSSAIMTEARVLGVAKYPKWSSRGLASRKIWTFLTQSIVTWFKYSKIIISRLRKFSYFASVVSEKDW